MNFSTDPEFVFPEEAEFRWLGGELLASIDTAHEIVGLGFRNPVTKHIIWEQLTNVADRPDVSFDVDGIEIRALLVAYGYKPTYLWHSHQIDTRPSEIDVDFFPIHLVETGVVFHAPSAQTTLYDASGVISGSNGNSAEPLATTDNTES